MIYNFFLTLLSVGFSFYHQLNWNLWNSLFRILLFNFGISLTLEYGNLLYHISIILFKFLSHRTLKSEPFSKTFLCSNSSIADDQVGTQTNDKSNKLNLTKTIWRRIPISTIINNKKPIGGEKKPEATSHRLYRYT